MSELTRIVGLPVIDPDWQAPDLTSEYRRPGGLQKLRPVQSKGLYFSAASAGLLGLIGVGWGKTLLSILIPLAAKLSRPLLMIRPSMRSDLARQWADYSQHWFLPRNLQIVTYDLLSRPDATAMLESMAPDGIICDEVQCLSDKESVRTRRWLKYMKAHPECKFFALSGSMTNRSLKDYAHIAGCALGHGSPVPLKYGDIEQWAMALDVTRNALEYGESGDIGKGRRAQAQERLYLLRDRFPADTLRESFQLRLASTPGVIVTPDAGVDIPIEIRARKPAVPDIVRQYLEYFAHTWNAPNGDVIEDALAYSRIVRQLGQGMYYRWVWPDNKPDEEWLEARANWHRALREYLPTSPTHRDSPFLASEACRHNPEHVPQYLLAAWDGWVKQKDKPTPPTETVWVDPFVVYDAIEWARQQNEPVLIWYEHTAIGEAIAKCGGFLFADVGSEADHMLASMRTAQTVVLSIAAHGTGKNLQLWRRSLVVCPPSNGQKWEQLIGRTHRPGQTSDCVYLDYNAHTHEFAQAMRNAREDAKYVEESIGLPQRLCYARHL